MFWPIPALSSLVALACALVGLRACLREWNAARDHAERLAAATPVVLLDSTRLEMALARIGNGLDASKMQLERAAVAVKAIGTAFEELRLPKAMAALRVAGLALRALRFLR